MRKKILPTLLIRLRICIVAFLLVLLSLFLFSFTVQKMKNDFLKQLGINQATADQKIGNSILGGYLASVKTVQVDGKLFRAMDDGRVYLSHDDGENWAPLANFGSHLDINSLTAIPGGRIYARFDVKGHGFELIYTLTDNTWRTV